MTDVIMPQMGESIAEGTISLWLVEVGQRVEADQSLVQVSTDKADVDIPSPVSGVLSEVLAKAGETIPVGRLIARIDETAPTVFEGPAPVTKKEGPAEHPIRREGIPAAEDRERPGEERRGPAEIVRECPECGPEGERSMFFSPAVMRLAVEYDIDLKGIKGTGEGGRVTKSDVMRLVRMRHEEGGEARAPEPEPAQGLTKETGPRQPEVQAERHEGEAAAAGPGAGGFGMYRPPTYEVEAGDTETPFTRLRQIIADHMVYSKRTSPHVTTVAEADFDHIVGIKENLKARYKTDMGVSLTFLPFAALALIRAIGEFPLMNSVVQGSKILTKKRINLGVAVDSERGLLVPVIHGAQGMGLEQLARAIDGLSAKVRDGKVAPDELAGGTFTITNPGREGNLFGTPIISQPQVGILRLGEIVKRPVAVEVNGEDAIAVRPMMFISLSYDHRVVDGLTANRFLHAVKRHIEEDKEW
jgi:2-oxoglutarate dehydrogenase E2 component (dihydrolipoamide succinyltransferase)